MTEDNSPPPIKIAFIIDNKVQDILHTDERLAAIFLSEPQIIDATDWCLQNNQDPAVLIGAEYINNEFIIDQEIKTSIVDVQKGQQPFPSWVWNEELKRWDSPFPYPKDEKAYYWDEPYTSWQLVPPAPGDNYVWNGAIREWVAISV